MAMRHWALSWASLSILRAHSPEASFSVTETSNRTKDLLQKALPHGICNASPLPHVEGPCVGRRTLFGLAAHSDTGVIP